jgi:hypothetical protein
LKRWALPGATFAVAQAFDLLPAVRLVNLPSSHCSNRRQHDSRQGAAMDPDMVRQQEEEEAASRLRKFATGRPPSAPPKDDAFVLRADPRQPFTNPRQPLKAAAPAPAAAAPAKRPPGWGAVLRATLYCLLFTILGLIGGILIGMQLGLVPWQYFTLGMVAGFVSGWQSAVAVLRKRYKLGVVQAYRAPLVPAMIMLASLVGGLAVMLPIITGSSLATAQWTQLLMPWLLSLGVGAAAGFVLALPKMRSNLRA